jgi:hypothetical protein
MRYEPLTSTTLRMTPIYRHKKWCYRTIHPHRLFQKLVRSFRRCTAGKFSSPKFFHIVSLNLIVVSISDYTAPSGRITDKLWTKKQTEGRQVLCQHLPWGNKKYLSHDSRVPAEIRKQDFLKISLELCRYTSLQHEIYRLFFFIFFCGEGPRSRCYGCTAALRLLVQPCDEDERWSVFLFLQGMEHRWNEIDRGKPKYSGKTCPSATFPPQIPHGLTRNRARASAVGSRRLTAWVMARPVYRLHCTNITQVCLKHSV